MKEPKKKKSNLYRSITSSCGKSKVVCVICAIALLETSGPVWSKVETYGTSREPPELWTLWMQLKQQRPVKPIPPKGLFDRLKLFFSSQEWLLYRFYSCNALSPLLANSILKKHWTSAHILRRCVQTPDAQILHFPCASPSVLVCVHLWPWLFSRKRWAHEGGSHCTLGKCMGLRPVSNPRFNPSLSYWKVGLTESEAGGLGTEWQEDKLDRTAHVWNHSEDLKA